MTVTWGIAGTGHVRVNYTNDEGCTATQPADLSVTIQPLTIPTVTVSASPSNNVCFGTEVTFTASVTNGGTSPTYHWLLNGNPV